MRKSPLPGRHISLAIGKQTWSRTIDNWITLSPTRTLKKQSYPRWKNTHGEQLIQQRPTPIATLLAAGGGRAKATTFDETIGNLTTHPIFQRNSGRHILISLHWVAFNTYPLYVNDFAPALSRNYPKLANVTVATHLDAQAIQKSFQFVQQHNISLKAFRGYHHIFATFRQATRCSFSLGLWASGAPFLPASYESWKQKSVSVFYHTRLKDSGSGSTPYRHGPLNLTLASLPNNSSLGLDIQPTQWLKEFTDSQFCLSSRGDTPHTHTLLRAVRVGCIPVVVSNLYPIFAPTLKSTLTMEDVCIFIKEYDFRIDMGGELRRLATLDEAYLRNKTKYLAWAQRVIFPDEANSLFVPVFFK
jgi:hypothetical protein